MSLLRPAVEAMTAYVPGEQPPPGARVIKLNTNENPYPPSPRVVEAIAAALGDGAQLRLYSDPAASELRRAASELTGLPVAQILAGNGSDELLALLVRAAINPGDVIEYPQPTYVLYETLAAAQGARVRTVPFARTYELPRALFGSDARVVFVASPNSPSGTSHPVAALGELADSLVDGVLVVDEALRRLRGPAGRTTQGATETALELVRTRENVAVLRTLSKSYSLAGMRIGLLFGAPALVAGIAKIKDSYNMDRLAIAAGAAALRDDAWMRANVAKIRATRDRLTHGLERLGLEVLPSAANFVFARLGSAERARGAYRSLHERGILVRYFDRPLLDDGLRITVGTDDEIATLLAALA